MPPRAKLAEPWLATGSGRPLPPLGTLEPLASWQAGGFQQLDGPWCVRPTPDGLEIRVEPDGAESTGTSTSTSTDTSTGAALLVSGLVVDDVVLYAINVDDQLGPLWQLVQHPRFGDAIWDLVRRHRPLLAAAMTRALTSPDPRVGIVRADRDTLITGFFDRFELPEPTLPLDRVLQSIHEAGELVAEAGTGWWTLPGLAEALGEEDRARHARIAGPIGDALEIARAALTIGGR